MCIVIDLRDNQAYMKALAKRSRTSTIPDAIYNWLKQKPESLIMLQDLRSARW